MSLLEESKKMAREYKSKERRIREIEKAIEGGARSAKEIAEAVGLNLHSIYGYSYKYGIILPKVGEKILSQIQQTIEEGARSVKEIAEKTGLTTTTIHNYSYNYEITLPNIRAQRISQIQQAIASGASSVKEIAEAVGLNPGTIKNHYSDQINRVSPRPKSKEKSQRNRLIREGLSLVEIAKRENVKHQAILQYINNTGQHEKWRQSRFHYKKYHKLKKKERINALEIIAFQIKEIARKNVPEEDKWAYQKAEEYFLGGRGRNYNFEKIFSLFKDYHEAEQKRKKVSLEKFAEKYDLWISVVGKIFKEVGLKPLARPHNKKRVATPKYKKQALERSIEIEMLSTDISYFLELPRYIITDFFSLHYKGDKERPKVNSFIKGFGMSGGLTYRIASQIYQAPDLFSEDEITKEQIIDVLGINKKIYDYATEHRSEIEPTITNALKVLYPNKKVKNPYIDFSIES